jgi:hypothetical protein
VQSTSIVIFMADASRFGFHMAVVRPLALVAQTAGQTETAGRR